MCGIVGAIVNEGSVLDGLIDGLRVLEYRGYDSSGVAVLRDGQVLVRKRAGRLEHLCEALSDGALTGAAAGIGHTRWATHGPPSDANAHPHRGGHDGVAVVHNGIIENYLDLKAELEEAGVAFESETDTEVLAHLIDRELAASRGDLAVAVRSALSRVEGYYAVAVLAPRWGGPEDRVRAPGPAPGGRPSPRTGPSWPRTCSASCPTATTSCSSRTGTWPPCGPGRRR